MDRSSGNESMDEDEVGSDDDMMDELAEVEDDDLDGVDDEDLSDMDFGDDDDDSDDESDGGSKNKKKKLGYDPNIFAAAEEFAEILDQEGTSKTKHGGANAMSNTDKAAVKQLDWEEKRHRWIKGYNKTVGGQRSRGGAHKKGVKRFKKR